MGSEVRRVGERNEVALPATRLGMNLLRDVDLPLVVGEDDVRIAILDPSLSLGATPPVHGCLTPEVAPRNLHIQAAWQRQLHRGRNGRAALRWHAGRSQGKETARRRLICKWRRSA
jgi:hypothetical protein